MPLNREWQFRIKAVEREFVAMRQAADHFQDAVLADPNVLRESLRIGEIINAVHNLEGTYIIRLFAEFETGARQYWNSNWDTRPATTELLEGLAARRVIPDTQLENGHLVREYRNSLVHERHASPEPIGIADARHFLCHFFSFLPPQW